MACRTKISPVQYVILWSIFSNKKIFFLFWKNVCASNNVFTFIKRFIMYICTVSERFPLCQSQMDHKFLTIWHHESIKSKSHCSSFPSNVWWKLRYFVKRLYTKKILFLFWKNVCASNSVFTFTKRFITDICTVSKLFPPMSVPNGSWIFENLASRMYRVKIAMLYPSFKYMMKITLYFVNRFSTKKNCFFFLKKRLRLE